MIAIQQEDFDPGLEQARLAADPGAGAVVTFTGLVRDMNLGDTVGALFLEHYPGMTEAVLQDIIDEARQRWALTRVRVIHRVGRLAVGERIVFVGVACAHRQGAFAGCEFIMDYLKTRAPFWKKECTNTGVRWLDARSGDQLAAQRWQSGEGRP